MIINNWIVKEPEGTPKGCLIGLPGRNISATIMQEFCSCMDCDNSLLICPEPKELTWYPQPNGINNQKEAISGMKIALEELDSWISKIQKCFSLTRKEIGIVGFSAGSVMALQLAAITKEQYAAVVSMAGAILDPDDLPEDQSQTPILLRHAIDDMCFSWEERFLPMKKALIEKNYSVFTSEKNYGGHKVSREDAFIIGKFISSNLGYEEIYHYDNDDDLVE